MFSFKHFVPVAAVAATLCWASPLHAAPGEKFPQTKTRLLRASEVKKLSPDQRQYAINEIFARHGLLFGEMSLRKQFLPFKWYRPEPGQTSAQTRAQFNSYERRNVERLAMAREMGNEPQAAVYQRPYKPGSQGLAGERYPETRLIQLFPADISAMTDAQLDFAINEIYARHGLVFGEMALRKHFLSLGWYKPKPDLPAQEVEATFSKIDRYNADILAAERNARDENH